jgi:hypothetical protein
MEYLVAEDQVEMVPSLRVDFPGRSPACIPLSLTLAVDYPNLVSPITTLDRLALCPCYHYSILDSLVAATFADAS